MKIKLVEVRMLEDCNQASKGIKALVNKNWDQICALYDSCERKLPELDASTSNISIPDVH